MRGIGNAKQVEHAQRSQRPDHEDIAVRKVDQFDDPVDHRIPQGDQRINCPGGDPDNQ